ncbi:hypothetical protein L6164_001523 [Bauhinia variegata]|uniref:Uncharacterized protein n=1 Tax=Bauhinia variegata TaxID=167791 RepID=A0ACB9Q933_BAUVA|nr:hypothetical protein L6164_001523 [Bauhinia variegata]
MGSSATLFLLCLPLICFAVINNAYEVSHDGRAITIDGQRKILISGSIHYPRSTAEMWPSLISKRRFIKTVQSEGLYALLRIGPYVCAEWNFGGLPVWLLNMLNMQFRTKNDAFMNEMKNFTTLIVDMMKHEKLFAPQGGPIIAAQIENEYGGAYGEDGKEYIKWCAQLADSYHIGVPWLMCQQPDAPPPMLNTCNGYYCDQFIPNSNNTPQIWTENWTGWFKYWGMPNPHRTAEDLAFAVARFFQFGGTFMNYYMYHGGTNFGRTAGGPYITTSYDYDAPLDEYVPAWSVSILPDCYTEVYNTAKVNAQTSIMVKKENETDDAKESSALKWQWRYEPHEEMINFTAHGSNLTANKLLDQKIVTNDISDYLWYITSVDINKTDLIWDKEIKLRVNTTGHGLHAFVNGLYLVIQLQPGKNNIALLSSTVGLQNGGEYYEDVEVGIHGPVELVADAGNNETITKDLSTNKWIYKTGLQGERYEFYNPLKIQKEEWIGDDLPSNKSFVWYKGQAWVNGKSLGRYWTSYLADQNGCSSTCDYRGAYSASKCMTNCGEPTQRWYHVPRSFLHDDGDNTLILMEELGGSPYNVMFQTVTVGKACAHSYEGQELELACQGERVISEIKFVSFGQPEGECGSFEKGHCESPYAISVIKKKCLGKGSCSVGISEKELGSTGCMVGQNRLAVEAICDTKVNER